MFSPFDHTAVLTVNLYFVLGSARLNSQLNLARLEDPLVDSLGKLLSGLFSLAVPVDQVGADIACQ